MIIRSFLSPRYFCDLILFIAKTLELWCNKGILFGVSFSLFFMVPQYWIRPIQYLNFDNPQNMAQAYLSIEITTKTTNKPNNFSIIIYWFFFINGCTFHWKSRTFVKLPFNCFPLKMNVKWGAEIDFSETSVTASVFMTWNGSPTHPQNKGFCGEIYNSLFNFHQCFLPPKCCCFFLKMFRLVPGLSTRPRA